MQSTDGPKPTVKILGERNTGTNYLDQLLALNLQVDLLPGVVPGWVATVSSRAERASRILRATRLRVGEAVKDAWFAATFRRNLGWKHAAARDDLETFDLAHRTTFVTLTKNPYSWLVSLHRNPYHASARHGALSEFVTSEWRTVSRGYTPRVLLSPVELWNLKNSSYLRLTERFRCVNLRYEDLLADPKAAIDRISEASGAARKDKEFTNVITSTKGDAQRFEDYRDYYLSERWADYLEPPTVAEINLRLDSDLAVRFGYEKIDPHHS